MASSSARWSWPSHRCKPRARFTSGSKARAPAARRVPIGLKGAFKQFADWLDEPDPGGTPPDHRGSRAWFGEVLPGSYAPNIDSEGVDGKLAGIQAIHAHDPAFDQDVFLAQVQRLFFAVIEAWTGLKPELSQGVMSTKIWEEQRAQVADYQARHWQNRLDGLNLISAIVAGAESDTNFDTVTVRINASSSDYDVDGSGTTVRGTRTAFEWTEDWIFQRPASLTTSKPGTVTSEVCPSCGARVNVDITSICPYCDAAVISGNFGWALTRIDRV